MDRRSPKGRRSGSKSPKSLFHSAFDKNRRSRSRSPDHKPYNGLSKQELVGLNWLSWHAFNKHQLKDIADRYDVFYEKNVNKDDLAETLYLYFQEQKIKDSVVPLFEIPYSKKELKY